jgi:hypothetical protein
MLAPRHSHDTVPSNSHDMKRHWCSQFTRAISPKLCADRDGPAPIGRRTHSPVVWALAGDVAAVIAMIVAAANRSVGLMGLTGLSLGERRADAASTRAQMDHGRLDAPRPQREGRWRAPPRPMRHRRRPNRQSRTAASWRRIGVSSGNEEFAAGFLLGARVRIVFSRVPWIGSKTVTTLVL